MVAEAAGGSAGACRVELRGSLLRRSRLGTPALTDGFLMGPANVKGNSVQGKATTPEVPRALCGNSAHALPARFCKGDAYRAIPYGNRYALS